MTRRGMQLSGVCQPLEHALNRRHFATLGQFGPINHHNRQTERAGSAQFGFGPCPASVLADHHVDGLRAEQRSVTGNRERPARHNHAMMRQCGRRFRRIDKAQDVMVLGLGREVIHMQAPKRQHHAFGRSRKRSDCSGHVRNMAPVIAHARLPFRSRQSQQGHLAHATGMKRVPAHLRGKRVSGINHMGDVMIAQISGQTVCSTKAPDTLRDRLLTRSVDPARIGIRRLHTAFGQSLREKAGLGCAAKNKEVGIHV